MIPDKRLHELKEKRQWKRIAEELHDPELEKEVDDESKIIKNKLKDTLSSNIVKGISKFEKRLNYKYDEGGTKFTAFNMKEELEEGNLDETGHYLFNKRSDD